MVHQTAGSNALFVVLRRDVKQGALRGSRFEVWGSRFEEGKKKFSRLGFDVWGARFDVTG